MKKGKRTRRKVRMKRGKRSGRKRTRGKVRGLIKRGKGTVNMSGDY